MTLPSSMRLHEAGGFPVLPHPSPNHEARPGGQRVDMLVFHYTGMATAAAALERLCSPAAKVSAHYVIEEDGRILALVPEDRRAWHAGAACWDGQTRINSCSIGIEMVNPGHGPRYRDFPPIQMRAACALARGVLARHPIPARRVLAHSDVAPARKRDPGERFDWKTLADAGIGLWPPDTAAAGGGDMSPGSCGPGVRALQRNLARFGYAVDATGAYDTATQQVVTALQRHFRPRCVDGVADAGTQAVLAALNEAVSGTSRS